MQSSPASSSMAQRTRTTSTASLYLLQPIGSPHAPPTTNRKPCLCHVASHAP
ncbi:UNVERIFIED_CONTAM: hypothetical protein FKN15_039405 [Acipenser sinensis]